MNLFPDFQIDRLPPQCGVEGDVLLGEDDVPVRVRFRAFRAEDHPDGPGGSAWSGWFEVAGERIHLAWDAFDWGDG